MSLGGIYIAALVNRYWHSLPTIYPSIVANSHCITDVISSQIDTKVELKNSATFSSIYWHIDTTVSCKEGEEGRTSTLICV